MLGDLGEKLIPELLKLAPPATRAAEAIAKLATVAMDNPLKAIGFAFVAAIAKAGISEIVRAGVERYVVGGLARIVGPWRAANTLLGAGGGAGAGAGMAGTGASAGLLGAIGAAIPPLLLLAAAGGAAAYGITKLDEHLEESGYYKKAARENDIRARDPVTGRVLSDHPDAEKIEKILKDAGVEDAHATVLPKDRTPYYGMYGETFNLPQIDTSKLLPPGFIGPPTAEQDRVRKMVYAPPSEEGGGAGKPRIPTAEEIGRAAAEAFGSKLSGTTLNVNVQNLPGPGAPAVNPFGRQ